MINRLGEKNKKRIPSIGNQMYLLLIVVLVAIAQDHHRNSIIPHNDDHYLQYVLYFHHQLNKTFLNLKINRYDCLRKKRRF